MAVLLWKTLTQVSVLRMVLNEQDFKNEFSELVLRLRICSQVLDVKMLVTVSWNKESADSPGMNCR